MASTDHVQEITQHVPIPDKDKDGYRCFINNIMYNFKDRRIRWDSLSDIEREKWCRRAEKKKRIYGIKIGMTGFGLFRKENSGKMLQEQWNGLSEDERQKYAERERDNLETKIETECEKPLSESELKERENHEVQRLKRLDQWDQLSDEEIKEQDKRFYEKYEAIKVAYELKSRERRKKMWNKQIEKEYISGSSIGWTCFFNENQMSISECIQKWTQMSDDQRQVWIEKASIQKKHMHLDNIN